MMTVQEIMKEIGTDSNWNKARRVFSSYNAMIEQSLLQKETISPIIIRRLELEAVEKICEIYGIDPRSA